MMYQRLIVLMGSLFLGFCTFAQNAGDTTSRTTSLRQQADTVARKDAIAAPLQIDTPVKTSFFTPKKVALFSAIVPGLGQFYNKQYWKVGVIYVGVGAAIYFANDNLKNYNKYRRLYAGFRSGDEKIKAETDYTEGNVKTLQDYYRRNLDLTVLFSALGYTLQVVDAVVFAHLKNFDISEDISLRARPVVTPQGGLGFGLVMNFK